MTIKEIDKQIQELQIKRQELYKKEIENFQKDARKHIGRCFKINGNEYAKVIGIPDVDFNNSLRSYFNKYQFPALFIDYDDEIPFYIDTIHSAAWGEGNDIAYTYEEIDEVEFNHEFAKILIEFYKKYLSIKE